MESAKQQNPVLIAVKGPSHKRKREIATKLAEFLHYPLIDEEDIIVHLQNFLSTTSSSSSSNFTSYLEESSSKILTDITKTQLQLKLHVIINTSHSQNHELLNLATSKRAGLFVIECKDGGDQIHDFYEFGIYGWISSIDLTKLFNVEEFARKILDVLKGNEKPARGGHKVTHQSTSIGFLKEDKIIPRRIFTEAHAHEFFFTEEPKMKKGSASSSKLNQCCNCCDEIISGPTYQCTECDEFILHKWCAEFYTDFEAIFGEGPIFYLKSNPTPSEYEFPEKNKCRSCQDYSSNCNNCLLQTHIKHQVVPTIWRYKNHEHPLSFVIMPFWCEYQYKCIVCSKYGKFIGYKCYDCNMDFHVSCAVKESPDPEYFEKIVTGPWGGRGGYEWDDGAHSAIRRLLIVYNEDCIDLIQIEYVDKEKLVLSKEHGSPVGSKRTKVEVRLNHSNEYLGEVYGTYGTYGARGSSGMVLSLAFKSNKRTYGPFGDSTRGTYFSSLHGSNGGHYKIVGFHGSSDLYLNSIGFYLQTIKSRKRNRSDKTSTNLI